MNELILEKYRNELMSAGVNKEDLELWDLIMDIYLSLIHI